MCFLCVLRAFHPFRDETSQFSICFLSPKFQIGHPVFITKPSLRLYCAFFIPLSHSDQKKGKSGWIGKTERLYKWNQSLWIAREDNPYCGKLFTPPHKTAPGDGAFVLSYSYSHFRWNSLSVVKEKNSVCNNSTEISIWANEGRRWMETKDETLIKS